MALFLICFNAYAEQMYNTMDSSTMDELINLGIIDGGSFTSEYVTREECLISILKAIGATSETNDVYCDMSYYYPVFRDVQPFNCQGFGFIYAAGLKGIALGDSAELGESCFHKDDNATYRQALCFMIRCLTEHAENIANIEDDSVITARAKEMGLFISAQPFNKGLDEPLVVTDFYTLLNQFICQKRYLYFDGAKCYKDETGSMLYIDYLRSRAKTK